MFLQNLSIINYKNISQSDAEFSPKLNCFVGHNGVRKTNYLDAIYFLSFCKSSFNSIDSQNIRHNEDFMVIQGDYVHADGRKDNIYCGVKRNHKKQFKRNGKAYGKLADHIGYIPLVMVSPGDVDIILGGSEDRRRFLDVVISQYDGQYLYEIMRYQHALKERNALLKMETPVDEDLIGAYEDVMADSGEKIHAVRAEFLKNFTPVFQNFYSQLCRDGEEINLEYVSNCQSGQLLHQIVQSRPKDQILGFSLCGIHRDDLKMTLGGYPIKHEGSQGQNKSCLIALKLAQYEFLKIQIHKMPILLLDDIFDKLDAMRVERILNLVASDKFGQIFVTDTDRNYLSHLMDKVGRDSHIFEIENGTIVDEVQ